MRPRSWRCCVAHRTANAELHQLGVPADRVQRRAQLVTHRREEFALRTARGLRGFARVAQRLDVGARPEPPRDRTVAIVHRRDAREKPAQLAAR